MRRSDVRRENRRDFVLLVVFAVLVPILGTMLARRRRP